MLDHRKKFIEAAQRYYDLSLFRDMPAPSEKAQALTNAISCTVLASQGPTQQYFSLDLSMTKAYYKLESSWIMSDLLILTCSALFSLLLRVLN